MGALAESDIKKVVALSTLRQLGVIVVAVRLGIPVVAFFHLVVHAFFKALLFISAGNIIHNSRDYQDLRTIGRIGQEIELSKAIVVFTKLSLCGLPFCSAYFSKELVLERLATNRKAVFITYGLIWTGVALTCAYSLRFVLYVLCSNPQGFSLRIKSDLNP